MTLTRGTVRAIVLGSEVLAIGAIFVFAGAPLVARALTVHDALPGAVSYIVILGNLPDHGELSAQGRERLDTGLSYFAQFPNATVIVSGGESSPGVIESHLMKNYLAQNGIPAGAIVEESLSRNTFENLHNSDALVPTGAPTIVVTSAYHTRRTRFLAHTLGFVVAVEPATSDSISYPHGLRSRVDTAYWTYREAAALLYYCVFIPRAEP